MKHPLRLLWLLVSGAWFLRLQFVPVRMWASFPTFNPPRGVNLWIRILTDWRHGCLFFTVLVILTLGIVLEIAKSRWAKWVNVEFYVVYLLLLCPSLIAILRNNTEPEAVMYVSAFGGTALVILIVNYLLYRPLTNHLQAEQT
jgi:hypothetical protein